jgi:hypothetical protein
MQNKLRDDYGSYGYTDYLLSEQPIAINLNSEICNPYIRTICNSPYFGFTFASKNDWYVATFLSL